MISISGYYVDTVTSDKTGSIIGTQIHTSRCTAGTHYWLAAADSYEVLVIDMTTYPTSVLICLILSATFVMLVFLS